MRETSYLDELLRTLEFRWRIGAFVRVLATTLIVSTSVSLVLAVIHVLLPGRLPIARILLILNGLAVVTALVLAAARRRSAIRLLGDADSEYESKELMSSAWDFANDGSKSGSRIETEFKELVIKDGETLSAKVEPSRVYPVGIPRRSSVAVALAVAIGVLFLLQWSGWFDRPAVDLTEEGLMIEDAGRRLAEAGPDEELQDLADEIRRLGERMRDGELNAEDARRRIDQLSERIEEQIRNLERMPEFDTNQEAELPAETEENVRTALQSGMSEGEVLELFLKARAEGDSFPDALSALEEATSDRVPDTSLGLDEEQLQELLDQLNLGNGNPAESAGTEELQSVQRSLQQAVQEVRELSEGSDEGAGSSEGVRGRSRGGGESEESDQGYGPDEEGEGGPGDIGGDEPVKDVMDDAFTRMEDANPVFREIEGVIGEGTIRDVLTRELPAEAISRMTESEREVAFERVIEEAVGRENTPPELQALVRNYFLRITLGNNEGEDDEQ